MIVKPAHGQLLPEVDAVIRSMLSSAKEHVEFSTGLTTGGLNRLRPEFENCLGRISTFHLLLDSTVDLVRFRFEYDWVFSHPNATVRLSQTVGPHWLMVDGRDFRLEESHDPPLAGSPSVLDENRSNTLILNCEKGLASELERTFGAWWDHGQAIVRSPSQTPARST